jgi:predicted O-methyltransferase YrrM
VYDPRLAYDAIQDHLTALVPKRHPVLQAMEAEADQTGFPIIGPAAGNACYLLARLIGGRRVFEMGSGYGYSTAWFARAVAENGGGEVHHVVWDRELSERARASLTEMGFGGLVQFHVAEAVQTLRETAGPFDLIFNDIEKEDYPGCLALIGEKLRSGGVLITDNLLWDGKIFDAADTSPATEGVRELTRLASSGADWISTILPIRDGLLVAMKR